MSARLFEVFIGAQAMRVGVLQFEAQGTRQHSTFTYDPVWAEAPEGFAISPTMPLAQRTFFSSKTSAAHSLAFPAPVADTCPDAWGRAILARDGSLKGRSMLDADLLAGVDDVTRMGALRICEGGSFVRERAAGRPIAPAVLDLEDLVHAVQNFETRTETERDLARLLGNGSSLGGARPKCNVVKANGKLAIAKFTSERDTYAVERAEVATLWLASTCGLTVPEAEIVVVAGKPVALITRFDRAPGGGRIPFISAQTMLDHSDATDGTYEEMVEAIRTHGSDVGDQCRELFGRVAFTILVNNVDDHLRNHGFIYTGGGRWRLSPAFDINPFPDRNRRLKTRIAGDTGDDASLDLLVSKSGVFGLDTGIALTVIADMAEAIAVTWPHHAKAAGMTKRETSAYASAFKHPELKSFLGRSKPIPSVKAT